MVAQTLLCRAPKRQRPVDDGLQGCDVHFVPLLALFHQCHTHLQITEGFAHDVFAQEDGIILGLDLCRHHRSDVVFVVHHAEGEFFTRLIDTIDIETCP